MKSLNKSEELWTNMSAKEVEISSYSASCCFNIKINSNVENQTKSTEPAKSR